MILKKLCTAKSMKMIHDFKNKGIPQSDIEEAFRNKGLVAPSKPTIRKYYNMDESVSHENIRKAYAKERVFDEIHCRELIIKTLTINNSDMPVSSIYDLLLEKLVETHILEQLPGNEQTLRNYCRYLKDEGIVVQKKSERVYDDVQTPKPGKKLQIDYGVQKIRDNEFFHFIALLLWHSRLLFVKAQDHRFNGKDTCNAINGFFTVMGGRVEQLVIDQDACLVVDENYGEIITTQVFQDFISEQDLSLFVCRKADPESKGAIENSVKFVKQNYLPSRMDLSLQELIHGVPAWCKRKNSRIHATELWKIDDHFQQFEKKTLRPLIISQYDNVGSEKRHITVSNTRRARFQTNKYVLPRDFQQHEAWYVATSSKILFYKREQDVSPVCAYDRPSPLVKNQTFEHKEFKQQPSRSYRDIYDRILSNWHAKELKHYLNGLHKEHENSRYLRDQFLGFEKMLKDRTPSWQELEEVMDRACRDFRYKLSQLTVVWDSYLQEKSTESPVSKIATVSEMVKQRYSECCEPVEKRDPEHYSKIMNSRAEEV